MLTLALLNSLCLCLEFLNLSLQIFLFSLELLNASLHIRLALLRLQRLAPVREDILGQSSQKQLIAREGSIQMSFAQNDCTK